MKLHPPDGQRLMSDAHDFALLSFRGDFQAIGQCIPLDDERMIARGRKGIGHAGKQILSVMPNRGGFAVHHPVIDYYLGAKSMADALMPQTNTKNGYSLGSKCLDDVVGKTGFAGRTRPGRHENALRLQRSNRVERNLIIPPHLQLHAQFAQILHEVVGKRIIIVDNEHHLINYNAHWRRWKWKI